MKRKIGTGMLLGALAAAALLAATWEGSTTLGVEVKDKAGKPIPGATVRVRLGDDPTAGPPPVETGPDGVAAFGGLAAGEWHVEVEHSHYMAFTAYVQTRPGKPAKRTFAAQVATTASFAPMRVEFVAVRSVPTAPAAAGARRAAAGAADSAGAAASSAGARDASGARARSGAAGRAGRDTARGTSSLACSAARTGPGRSPAGAAARGRARARDGSARRRAAAAATRTAAGRHRASAAGGRTAASRARARAATGHGSCTRAGDRPRPELLRRRPHRPRRLRQRPRRDHRRRPSHRRRRRHRRHHPRLRPRRPPQPAPCAAPRRLHPQRLPRRLQPRRRCQRHRRLRRRLPARRPGSLRSAELGNCPDCPAGQWAAIAEESVAPPSALVPDCALAAATAAVGSRAGGAGGGRRTLCRSPRAGPAAAHRDRPRRLRELGPGDRPDFRLPAAGHRPPRRRPVRRRALRGARTSKVGARWRSAAPARIVRSVTRAGTPRAWCGRRRGRWSTRCSRTGRRSGRGAPV